MPSLSDEALRALIDRSPDQGWRAFVDQYTPTLVALIERSGIRDRDEAMEIYTLICEHLSAGDCARLRRWNASKGSLPAWLAVVVRRLFVDWVRSRAGRRRLFGAIQQLDAFHQQVFRLYYWSDRTPSEIAEELTVAMKRPVGLLEVLGALDAIHDTMNDRHFSELVSMTTRSNPPVSLDAEFEGGRIDPPDAAATPEAAVEQREREEILDRALAELPHEDAAIVRLHYYQGLSIADVQRALHLPQLTRARLAGIVAQLKSRLQTPVAAPGGRPAIGHPGGQPA